MEKIKLSMPVIVEGKYDKIKLANVIDGIIITTKGFEIYKDREKLALIRKYAASTGIIILTDSDAAGFQIRNHIKGAVSGKIINVYIPDIFGKERRKEKPSAEGKLGVEGVDAEILRKAFREAGVDTDAVPREPWADMSRLVQDGLSGGTDSSAKRKALCHALGLPERISAKGLIEALNVLYSEEEYNKALKEI